MAKAVFECAIEDSRLSGMRHANLHSTDVANICGGAHMCGSRISPRGQKFIAINTSPRANAWESPVMNLVRNIHTSRHSRKTQSALA